jgi:hypothetical protein
MTLDITHRGVHLLNASDVTDLIDQHLALRKLLWLRHGCEPGALYGDDGEMQCGKCLVDFKRMTPDQMLMAWHGRPQKDRAVTAIAAILEAIDRLAESQRKELNGNPLTDGRYQGIKKSAEIIREAISKTATA